MMIFGVSRKQHTLLSELFPFPLFQPDLKLFDTQQNKKQDHTGNDQRFLPYVLKTQPFYHDRFHNDDKPAGRHDIAENLQGKRHILNREDEP